MGFFQKKGVFGKGMGVPKNMCYDHNHGLLDHNDGIFSNKKGVWGKRIGVRTITMGFSQMEGVLG